jgi:hypothetical protein
MVRVYINPAAKAVGFSDGSSMRKAKHYSRSWMKANCIMDLTLIEYGNK